MRLVFFGSGAFSVPTLRALANGGHEIAAVFTRPDRPSGRGRRLQGTPVKEEAMALGLPVHRPDGLKDGVALATLRQLDIELAVVVAYGHLIPPEMLAVPPHGFINVHASLLPRWRGAAPVPRAILAGDAETGVTIFRLNERFDEGDVLARARTPIGFEDTAATVLERLAPIGAEQALAVVGQFVAGWAHPVPQAEPEATRAPKLKKEEGEIDWAASRAAIDRQVRAFQPWPLAFTAFPTGKGPQRVSILRVTEAPPPARSAAPGTILQADAKHGIVAQCGDGPLYLHTIRPEGKREMSGAEYMRGAALTPGVTLGSSRD